MSKPNDEEKRDIFVSKTIFPEPSKVFDFKPSSLSEIKKSCLVVIDTNALLLPYLAKGESLQQIKNTYKALINEKRLIIPDQVAREFSKNRANKIAEIFQFLTQKRASIAGTNIQISQYHLLDELPEYQRMMEIKTQINKQVQELCKTMEELSKCIQNWNWNDPVSLIYSDLGFSKQVYTYEFDENEFKQDLERRYFHKIPPGYKDNSKIDDGVGDLLIWKTILKIGKDSHKPVVFITGDEKSDWRHKIEDNVLYPRYELIDEFRRETNGNTFHLARFSEFMQLFEASEEVVSEIAEIESVSVKEETPSFFISEEEFIDKLNEYLSQTHDNYIGVRKFIETFLNEKHCYDVPHSKRILDKLVEQGILEIYDEETSKGHVAKAIRFIV